MVLANMAYAIHSHMRKGLVSPGQVYVGGDSHTNTTGALGAFACGLGHTDMAYVMLNGKIWFKVPETVLFKLNGKLPEHVMAKDLILQIIGDIGTDGGAYGAMQFAGSGIDAMPVEERITLTNMTTVLPFSPQNVGDLRIKVLLAHALENHIILVLL